MSIQVRFFASLAESVGRRETGCAHAPGMTVADVWRQVNGDAAPPAGTLCARNQNYCRFDDRVEDGDEVAFFPRVTGG